MPVPFIGDVKNSEIVILLANPKFVDEWVEIERNHPIVREKYLKVFAHNSDFPFFCLDPSLKFGNEYGLGEKYWRDRLKDLNDYYNSEDEVLKKISVIQFNPYSSVNFKSTKKLSSQDYNFYLVRKAIERNAKIILARGKKLWLKNVPELQYYPYLTLKSHINTYLSKQNCPDLFKNSNNMKKNDSEGIQNFTVYPIRKNKDEDYDTLIISGSGRSFSNCKLEVSEGVAIFRSKSNEVEGVFSLNKFFIINDYS